MPRIQPAIRPPLQSVRRRMSDRRFVKSVEHNLRRTIGNVVAVSVGNEQQVRQTDGPDAAVADFDTGQLAGRVPEDGPFIMLAISICVFQDHDAVALIPVETPCSAPRPAIILSHPQAAPFISCDGNRVLHIGLGRKDRQNEPRRQLGRLNDIGGRHRRSRRLFRILGDRKVFSRQYCQRQ